MRETEGGKGEEAEVDEGTDKRAGRGEKPRGVGEAGLRAFDAFEAKQGEGQEVYEEGVEVADEISYAGPWGAQGGGGEDPVPCCWCRRPLIR